MDIFQFLNESYTAYHTVANVRSILLQNGFVELPLHNWDLKVGGKYFTTQNGSSVVAFKVGKNPSFGICESHTDSPAFKVKGGSTLEGNGVVRINTEKYGGALLYTYLDRPMKVAGRLLVETQQGVESRLVVSNYNVVIPSLCIHHNPTANDGVAINPQVELPLFSQGTKDIYASLTDGKVLDADLFVVPATTATHAGCNNEFVCSARLDNLTSVYSSVQALVNCTPHNIAVVACLDNEEIGSGTQHGSADYLNFVLAKIEHALSLDSLSTRQGSLILSVDNGHAVHPAHPEKSDPKMNVTMNNGIVIKHHVNYATEGMGAAIVKKILADNNIPCQDCYNRSDVRCGSTLGLVSSKVLQIKTCDIGLAQLAMHSACETIGTQDIKYMQQALTAFLSADIAMCGDKVEIK